MTIFVKQNLDSTDRKAPRLLFGFRWTVSFRLKNRAEINQKLIKKRSKIDQKGSRGHPFHPSDSNQAFDENREKHDCNFYHESRSENEYFTFRALFLEKRDFNFE